MPGLNDGAPMKGYILTSEPILVGRHTVQVQNHVDPVDCDLVPRDANLRGLAVYETREEAQRAMGAHHDALLVGVAALHRIVGKRDVEAAEAQGDTASEARRELVARGMPQESRRRK